MALFDAVAEVIGWDECPLYWIADTFRVSKQALIPQYDKQVCLILASDILEVIRKRGNMKDNDRHVFDCSGCTGLIRLEYKKVREEERAAKIKSEGDINAIVNLLHKLPFFQSLNNQDIVDLVSFLKLKKFSAGDTVIKKGDYGRNLFIIVSGKVSVLGDGHVTITELGSGEIFGEMSLLSGDPVGATIKVSEPARLLYLNGEDFKEVLLKFPALQMYLACLLAQRLAKTNMAISEQLSSGMTGRLEEIPPSGLLQALNLNQKTGVLSLELSFGKASIIFNEGEVTEAKYQDKKNEEAFYAVLEEKKGRFKFTPEISESKKQKPPIREFMSLLMEGVRRVDEKDENG